MKNFSLILFASIVLFACGANEELTETFSADSDLTFEIVDSVAVDYLGRLSLSDISPDKNHYLFYDGQRNNFVVTNKAGEITNEFSKSTDTPDAHGQISFNPAFFGNDKIVAVGRNGYFIYNFDGSIWKNFKETNINSNFFMSIFGSKTLHYAEIDGEQVLLTKGPATFEQEVDVEKALADYKSITLVKPNEIQSLGGNTSGLEDESIESPEEQLQVTKGFSYHISLPQESIYRQMPDFTPLSAGSFMSVDGDKILIGYNKDMNVYTYEYANGEFSLVSTLNLNPDLIYIDKPDADNEDGEISVPGGGSVRFSGGSIGEGSIRGVYLYGNQIISSYYPGVKPEDRVMPEIQRGEDGSMRVTTGNQPRVKNRFQLFIDGVKMGSDFEAPENLSGSGLQDDEYLWFARNTADDEEESDFITYYKVKVASKS
tara:strand:- start:230 stop:1516 length:1287 start_codon:yes stop_codon:yes gene_type:complete